VDGRHPRYLVAHADHQRPFRSEASVRSK
jgi:hypothetical protein